MFTAYMRQYLLHCGRGCREWLHYSHHLDLNFKLLPSIAIEKNHPILKDIMKFTRIYQALSLVISSLSALTTTTSTSPTDPAFTCYTSLGPSLSNATRSIPWGTPYSSFQMAHFVANLLPRYAPVLTKSIRNSLAS